MGVAEHAAVEPLLERCLTAPAERSRSRKAGVRQRRLDLLHRVEIAVVFVPFVHLDGDSRTVAAAHAEECADTRGEEDDLVELGIELATRSLISPASSVPSTSWITGESGLPSQELVDSVHHTEVLQWQ